MAISPSSSPETAGDGRSFRLSARRLDLTILPTERCNFRCVYCYQDFDLPQMAESTIQGIKALLATRAPSLDHLGIDWFGGEPLLAPTIVEDVQGFAQNLALEHSVSLSGAITTNASLLERELFLRLVNLGIHRYQISIDGPQEFHDKKRVYGDGRGTYDRIWRNLKGLQATTVDAEILLRIHVDEENRAAIPVFLEDLSKVFGTDPRFKIFVRPTSKLGGRNDSQLVTLGTRDSETFQGFRQQATDLGFNLHGEARAPICYAAAANAFVIRPNGDITKCTTALNDPANRVGRLHEDGRLELVKDKMMPWIEGLFTGEPSALVCPLNHMRTTAHGETAVEER